MPPDSHTGEGLRRPSPDPTPLGAPALRASAPRSGPSVTPSSCPPLTKILGTRLAVYCVYAYNAHNRATNICQGARPPYGLPFPKIGGSQPQPKTAIAIILGTDEAIRTANLAGTFTGSIRTKESPWKIWEKRERGRIQGLPQFFSTPCYLRNG